MPTYGTQKLRICLNLPETLSWTFTIADVRSAVLVIDFSSHYKLLIDTANQTLARGPHQLIQQTDWKQTDRKPNDAD